MTASVLWVSTVVVLLDIRRDDVGGEGGEGLQRRHFCSRKKSSD